MVHAVFAFALILVLVASSQVEARKCKPPPPKRRPPTPKHLRSPPPPPATPKVTRTLTIFGDSLSDNGNAFARSGNTVPDPAFYFNGRVSNGIVWPEYLVAQSGGQLSKVNNFAYSDACACQSLSTFNPLLGRTPASAQPFALDNQTNLFLAARGAPNPAVLNTAVMLIGSNDFRKILESTLAGGSQASAAAAATALLTCIASAVLKLAGSGETRIVVGNLPPVDITPLFRAYPASIQGAVKGALNQFNAGLGATVLGLQARLPNTTHVYVLDANAILLQNFADAVAANETTAVPCLTSVPPNQPSLYGSLLANVTTVECAAKGVNYAFFDREHPTTQTHASFAAGITKQFQTWGLY